MGILRLYLALCVIAAHTPGYANRGMLSGKQAVQIFYIISGFYMALVLSTRYRSLKDFYTSRFLRVFPPYWIVCAATLVWCLITGIGFHRWLFLEAYTAQPLAHNGVTGLLLTSLSNLTLLGQDWVFFLQHDAGQSLSFTSNFWTDPYPLWHYLLLPQAWSIGVELTFYAFAPHLNRLRTPWLVALALAAFGARIFAYRSLGLAHDPWDYRFFPFEISLFVSGMLGYRAYAWCKERPGLTSRLVSSCTVENPGIAIGLTTASIAGLYLVSRVTHYLFALKGDETGLLLLLPAWIAAVPLLFILFGRVKYDRWVGELSYPVYLIHFVVVRTLDPVLTHFHHRGYLFLGTTAVTLALSAALYMGCIAPLDKRRHHLAKPARTPDLSFVRRLLPSRATG